MIATNYPAGGGDRHIPLASVEVAILIKRRNWLHAGDHMAASSILRARGQSWLGSQQIELGGSFSALFRSAVN